MIGMRTILEVADNCGARRLSCILPRGGDLGLRAGLGDVVTAGRERSRARFGHQEGQSGALRDRPHAQGDAAQGWHLHPFRFQRRRVDQRCGRAGRHARVRTGGQGTARQEVHEDRFAGPRGNLMAIAKKKAGSAGADRSEEGRHRQGDHRPRQGQDRPRAAGEPRDRAHAGGARR